MWSLDMVSRSWAGAVLISGRTYLVRNCRPASNGSQWPQQAQVDGQGQKRCALPLLPRVHRPAHGL